MWLLCDREKAHQSGYLPLLGCRIARFVLNPVCKPPPVKSGYPEGLGSLVYITESYNPAGVKSLNNATWSRLHLDKLAIEQAAMKNGAAVTGTWHGLFVNLAIIKYIKATNRLRKHGPMLTRSQPLMLRRASAKQCNYH